MKKCSPDIFDYRNSFCSNFAEKASRQTSVQGQSCRHSPCQRYSSLMILLEHNIGLLRTKMRVRQQYPDQRGTRLPPCPSRTRGRQRPAQAKRLGRAPVDVCCLAHMGPSLCDSGSSRLRGSPSAWSTRASDRRTGTAPPSPHRSRPPAAWLALFAMALPRPGHGVGPTDRGPPRPCTCARGGKKNHVSSYRPTGRLEPAPAELADGSLELAARADQARRGAILGLSADDTLLWRCALPRAGWGRTAPRARLLTPPLRHSQSTRQERLTRQAWVRSRSWSRLTSGVFLRVLGAVQYGTAKVFSTLVPHCEAQEWRQYLHPGMATCQNTEPEVVMVVDRRGIHRAHKLATTLDPDHEKFRCHFLPAHGGHHRNPIAGFWRVMKDTIGAGRCFGDLPQLDKRTRQVLMAHQERPISAFHW
jgi:hypothetical protein